MRIAVIGPLGMPADQGGVSRHCEELSTRLAARGHQVTVFGRSTHVARSGSYKGVDVRRVPVVPVRGLETFGYGAVGSLLADADVVHYHSITAAAFAFVPRLRGRRVAATIHSTDWQFGKWGPVARSVLRASERILLACAAEVVAVSRSLADDLTSRYPGRRVTYIPNGVAPAIPGDPGVLETFGLESGGYLLFVGRLVPEKGVHLLLDAAPDDEVAIVGGPRHSEGYVAELRGRAGPRVRFCGVQSRDAVAALYRSAAAFVAPSLHEGFNLTVAEAMSYGCPVVASDIPAHREVLGGAGELFASGDAGALRDALIRTRSDAGRLRQAGLERIASGEYDWDRVAIETERVLLRAAAS